jgi:hypothetical protein
LARLSGDLTTARARANRAFDVSEQLGKVGLRILARLELARTLAECDEWAAATGILEELLTLIEDTGVHRVLRVPASAHLAESLAVLGRPGPATERCETALAGVGGAGWLNGYVTHLAHGRVLAATVTELAAAAAALDRADDMVHRAGARALEPTLLDERARLAWLAGDEPGSEQRLREAAARCRALDMPRREAQLGRWRNRHG